MPDFQDFLHGIRCALSLGLYVYIYIYIYLFSHLWCLSSDAFNYVILGDPPLLPLLALLRFAPEIKLTFNFLNSKRDFRYTNNFHTDVYY